MESELAACPVPNCGRDVEVTEEGVFCICGYRLDDELEGMEDEPGVTTFERHNTLARRAEIGALVERILLCPYPANSAHVDLLVESEGVTATRALYRANEVDTKPDLQFACEEVEHLPTLLDALRALAKEVSGE